MKIEVDLVRLLDHPGQARTCAVALLSALPWDEAELAVKQWRAACSAADRVDAVELDTAAAIEEAVTVPPQDVGYAVAPADASGAVVMARAASAAARASVAAEAAACEACEACGGQVDRPGNLLCDSCMAKAKPRQHPDYKVGGWVVTDLGELAQIVGIKENAQGRHLKVEIDDGEQKPTEKLISIDRVRPATKVELEEATDRVYGKAEVDRAADSLPAGPEVEEKKKRGRPKKAEPAVVYAEMVGEPKRDSHPGGNGEEPSQDAKAAKYEGMDLRQLCKVAENEAGRPRLIEVFKAQGVGKLDGLEPQRAAALRAAVLELVP